MENSRKARYDQSPEQISYHINKVSRLYLLITTIVYIYRINA